MGMYTQLLLDIELKKDTPKEIIDTLKEMVDIDGDCKFWNNRLNWCFNSSSYYFNNNHHANIQFDEISEVYKLFVYCDFKDYDDEIKILLSWLKPYIEDNGDMIGYTRYEEEEMPIILFVKDIVEAHNV